MKKFSWAKIKNKLLLIVPGSLLGYSFISTIPGCAIESLTFINSVKKQINNHIPKNKFVIDKNGELFQTVGNTILKNTFILDADLSINFYDQKNLSQKSELEAYATSWFDKTWKPIIDNKSSDIDLNTFSLDVVQFDISVSKKFYNTGLTSTGLQFGFGSMDKVFSNQETSEFGRYESVINQDLYNSYLEYNPPSIFAQGVQKSIGNYAVNQKTFFINYQLSIIQQSVTNIFISPFVNKNLTNDDVSFVNISDFKSPNYISTLNYLRFSIVLFFLSIGAVAACYPIYFICIKGRK